MKKIFSKKIIFAMLFLVFLGVNESNARQYHYFMPLPGLMNSECNPPFCGAENEPASISLSSTDITFQEGFKDARTITVTLSTTEETSYLDDVTIEATSSNTNILSNDTISVSKNSNTEWIITVNPDGTETDGTVNIEISAKKGSVEENTTLSLVTIENVEGMITRWTTTGNNQTVSFSMIYRDNIAGSINWGDGTGTESFTNLKTVSHIYATAGTYTAIISGDLYTMTSMDEMFRGKTIPSGFDISNWNVSNVINMSGMFYSSILPTGFDISGWNTPNLTNMNYMFNAANLPSGFDISGWNTSNVDRMSSMFRELTIPTGFDISGWDVSSVLNMDNMFRDAIIPIGFDISNWNTPSLVNIIAMFLDVTLPAGFNMSNWNTSNVTGIHSMFAYGTLPAGFDISGWELSNVNDIRWIFHTCKVPAGFNVNSWDIPSGADMESAFYNTTYTSGGSYPAACWYPNGSSNCP